jgi:hypothetical protein
VGRIYVQDAVVDAVVDLRDTVVQWTMVCVEVVVFVKDFSVELVIGLEDEAVFRFEIDRYEQRSGTL